MTLTLLQALVEWICSHVELRIYVEDGAIIVGFRIRREASTIQFLNNGKVITMLNLTDTQQSTLTLAIKDAKGKPAKVDGVPEWASTDEAVATVTDISADGMTATVKAQGPGLCQVTAAADADLGAGVKTITGFIDVNVAGGGAVTVELSAGAITEQ